VAAGSHDIALMYQKRQLAAKELLDLPSYFVPEISLLSLVNLPCMK
jgi:hypothetical protein